MSLRLSASLFACLLAGTASSIATAQSPSATDHWYGTATAAWLTEVDIAESVVLLGQAPLRISAPGQFQAEDGSAFSLALGRQFIRSSADPAGHGHAWRLEGEVWAGKFNREHFRTGLLAARLSDTISARAAFINGLYRVWGDDHRGLWLGAGIGFAKIEMPRAVVQSGCSCLDKAEGDGASYQLKLGYEHAVSERTAWSVGVGYIWLPDSSTYQEAPAFSQHGDISSGAVHLAIRYRFP